MYAMIKDDVETFRLLSLNLVLLLHGIQKLSFRSKGHHSKGSNCLKTEGKLTLYSPQIIWLRGLYSCFVRSVRSASVQRHCEAPTMSMRGLIEKRSGRPFDLPVRGTVATNSWQIHSSEHTSLFLPLHLFRHNQ